MNRRGERGQAMAAVVGLVGLLILVPLAVQLLATGQVTVSQRGVDQQEALEAAHAGLSDYINHIQGPNAYLKHCSKGTFACSTSGLAGVDAANPAFADTADDSHWAYVHNAGSAAYESYQYLVDSDGADPTATSPQTVTVYVTGRAGRGSSAAHTVLHYVYQTVKASLVVTPGIIYSSTTPPGVSSTITNANCSGNGYVLPVPTGATSAMVTVEGAQGGGATGGLGGGGSGAIEVAYPPVSAGETLSLDPGGAGASGNFQLLALNLYGGGGGGCSGSLNVGGGNGGSAFISLLSGIGGGGGGASVVCLGTSCTGSTAACSVVGGALSPTPCVIAVGAGGGGTGGPSVGWSPGTGGYWSNNGGVTWTATGQAGTGLSVLGVSFGGAGGAAGGSSSALGGSGVTLIGALDGAGGGGGGGFPQGGAGGKSGGDILDIVGVLGAGGGAGGGGGGGGSVAAPSCTGCPAAPAPAAIGSYPVTGGNGPNGVVTVTFFGAGSGGSQKGSVLEYTASIQLLRPVPPNSTS